MPRFDNPCVGYVFIDPFLFRAKVKRDLVVTANGETHIEGPIDSFKWYTYRRIENAISRLQKAEKMPKDGQLNLVVYSPDLADELKKDSLAVARFTRDFILHMLTAGKGVTAAELPDYEAKADAIFDRMLAANKKTTEKSAVA